MSAKGTDVRVRIYLDRELERVENEIREREARLVALREELADLASMRAAIEGSES